MTLPVTDDQGVVRQGYATFLVEFDSRVRALGTLGASITLRRRAFKLDKPQLRAHRNYICESVPLDGEVAICRSRTLRSLVACFPFGRLRIKVAETQGTITRMGVWLVESTEPVNYEELSFQVRTEVNSLRHQKVIFRPLNNEFQAPCMVCRSEAHFTERCPRFRPCLLKDDCGLEPRLVATSLELREGRQNDELAAAEEVEDDAAPIHGNPANGGKPSESRADDRKAIGSSSSQKPSITLEDYCHFQEDAAPFVVRNKLVEYTPALKSPQTKLVLTLLSGRGFRGDLEAVKAAISAQPKSGLQNVREILSDTYIAMFSFAKAAQDATGRVIAMDSRSFRLDELNLGPHHVFTCRGIPFGSDGVGQVPALHSILESVPGSGELCVLQRKDATYDPRSWTGDLVVVSRQSIEVEQFSFALPVRGSERVPQECFILRFKAERDDGTICGFVQAMASRIMSRKIAQSWLLCCWMMGVERTHVCGTGRREVCG